MTDAAFDIGARLLAMRKAAQLSQRQLAERAGVPHAQISIIEKNKSSPSIATLRKILSGLGMTMADFFDSERQAPEGPFFGPEDLLDLTSKLPVTGVADVAGRIAFSPDRRRAPPQPANPARGLRARRRHRRGPCWSISRTKAAMSYEGALELTVGDEVRVLRPRRQLPVRQPRAAPLPQCA